MIRAPSATGPEPGEPVYDARYYAEDLHREHWFRNNPAKHALRWLAVLRMVAPERTDVVVDLGCAAGEHTLRLAPQVARVIGVDSAQAAIALASEHGRGVPNVAFVRADATDLAGIADASADKVMAIDFVEHIDDAALRRVASEAWRVLRPGGRFAIYTPCGTHYVERMKAAGLLAQIPGHVAVRTPRRLDALLLDAHPWRRLERFYLPSTYPGFGWLDRALARVPGLGAWFRFRYCLALGKPGP